MPLSLPCPICPNKPPFGSTKGLNSHFTKVHPDVELSEDYAREHNCVLCPHCARIYARGPSNSIPRHNNCSHQQQPPTPQAQREFARAEEALAHDHLHENILTELQPIPSGIPARHDIPGQLLCALGDAATMKDGPRVEALLLQLLAHFKPPTSRVGETAAGTTATGVLKRAKRALRLLRKGAPFRKVRLAMDTVLRFVVTADNVHLLRGSALPTGGFDSTGLFIPRQVNLSIPDNVWSDSQFEVKINHKVVLEVLKSRDRTTGRGLSGMGYGDLQVFSDNPTMITALTEFIEFYLNGGLSSGAEAASALRQARLVTLAKSSGKPRGIAVREVLTNLAFAVLVRQFRPQICEHLSRFDVGFGTPDCCAFPIHLLNTYITRCQQNEEPYVILKLDIKNAYGTTHRAAILELLCRKLPQLVRPFLVGYEFATPLHLEGWDGITADEGLLQGDPAAPAFAQLLYAECCQKVRDQYPDLEMVISYFDDIVLCGPPRIVRRALGTLTRKLSRRGLSVQLDKSLAFTTHPLDRKTASSLASRHIQVHNDGFTYLGTPIGTPEFIRAELERLATRLSTDLSELSELHFMSQIDTQWADAQGLFALANLSLNHTLRHLLRTVAPIHLREIFPGVDRDIQKFVGGIFGLQPTEFTPWRRKRLFLPYRHGGLGFIPLTDCSEPAFIGCIYRHRRLLGPETLEMIPGALEAHQTLITRLGLECLPSSDTLMDPTPPPNGQPERDLHQELTERIWKEYSAEMQAEATEFEKFVSTATSESTSMDVFRAPISNRRYRLPSSAFVMAGRLALALPVCEAFCRLCNKPIATDGQHASAHHCNKRVIDRHNGVRDTLASFCRLFNERYDLPGTIMSEVPMDSIPGIAKLGRANLRCDFMLRHDMDINNIFFDVQVVHPVFDPHPLRPPVAVESAWNRKRQKYLAAYDIPAASMQPMTFDVYGRWAKLSQAYLFKLLKQVTAPLQDRDKHLCTKLWLDLRYRVATTIARRQARVLEYFHWRNRSPTSSISAHTVSQSSSERSLGRSEEVIHE